MHSSHKSTFLKAAKIAFKIHWGKSALLQCWNHSFSTAAPYLIQASLPRAGKTNRKAGAEKRGMIKENFAASYIQNYFVSFQASFAPITSHGNSFRRGGLCWSALTHSLFRQSPRGSFPHPEMGRHLQDFTHFASNCKQDLSTEQYSEGSSPFGGLPPCYALPDSVCPISDFTYIPFSFLSQPLPTAHHLPVSSSWSGGKSDYPVAPHAPSLERVFF